MPKLTSYHDDAKMAGCGRTCGLAHVRHARAAERARRLTPAFLLSSRRLHAPPEISHTTTITCAPTMTPPRDANKSQLAIRLRQNCRNRAGAAIRRRDRYRDLWGFQTPPYTSRQSRRAGQPITGGDDTRRRMLLSRRFLADYAHRRPDRRHYLLLALFRSFATSAIARMPRLFIARRRVAISRSARHTYTPE